MGADQWFLVLNPNWLSLQREFATDLLACAQNKFMHFILHLLPSRPKLSYKTVPLLPVPLVLFIHTENPNGTLPV